MTRSEPKDRQKELYEYLGVPRTVEQVGIEFGVHDQTARMMIWALRDQKRALDLGGKPKKWKASGIWIQGNGPVTLSTSSGSMELVQPVRNWSPTGGNPLPRWIGGALAYLWRRAYYSMQDQERIVNVVKQGTLDPTLEVRRVLEELHRIGKMQVETIEQMLNDLPALWTDSTDIMQMLGPDLTPNDVEDAAEWFAFKADQLLAALRARK